MSKNERDDTELNDAADGRRDKRAADAESEGGGHEAIEEDEGESKPDVRPGEVCFGSVGSRVHGEVQ